MDMPIEVNSSNLQLASFRTLVRPSDAVVTDHKVRGVPVLPGVAYLDAVIRAAQAQGHDPATLELRNILFESPVAFGDGSPRQVTFRCRAHGDGVRVQISAASVEGGDAAEVPCGELLVARTGDRPDELTTPFELSAIRRALANESGTTDLGQVYETASHLGVSHGDFMRVRGRSARLEDRVVAEFQLHEKARRHRGDFILSIPWLDAAIVTGVASALDDSETPYLPVFIGRCRITGIASPDDGVCFLETGPGGGRLRGDVVETDLRLYDSAGGLLAELERVTAMRSGTRETASGTAAHPKSAGQEGSAPRKPLESGDGSPRSVRSSQRGIDVAIVGLSGRYPGASDIDQLWRNLSAGRDSVGTVPPSRWDSTPYDQNGHSLSRHGAFLDDVDMFDPRFFGIPPSVAASLDPQERLFLEVAYAAIEHAGYEPAQLSRKQARTGVFVGATWTDYRLLGAESAVAGAAPTVPTALSSIANRVSFTFDFSGPSLAIDTACSSSLSALHLACRSLANGEIDVAIAGGANLILHPDKFLLLSQMNLASSDGRCRAFGAGGDGYVPGEGVGALILKPRARAEADGDTIYGVIRATAMNHGGRSAGFTVPHPVAQSSVIASALEASGVDPQTIGYVEAHGTGTSLGDPIETEGLARAYGRRNVPLAIGSVKSNIGHLEAAAGVAAVTRALLQLHHGCITPSLHSSQLNPEIDFAKLGLRVPQAVEHWPRPVADGVVQPRRTGVSSFGAGGSNAHVIIEEYVAQEVEPCASEPEVFVLSARTAEQLRHYAEAMSRYLRACDDIPFRDLVRTLQVGRPALAERLAFVARTSSSAADELDRYLAGSSKCVHMGSVEGNGSSDPAGLATAHRAGDLDRVARLWCHGATPAWIELNGGPARRRALPGYPFQRSSYWIAPPPAQASKSQAVGQADVRAGANLPAPAGEGDTFIDRARSLFESRLKPVEIELESFLRAIGPHAASAVHRRLMDMGLRTGTWTRAEVLRQLDLAPAFHRFFDACIEVLAHHGLVRLDGDDVKVRAPQAVQEQLRASLIERHPEASPFLRLLDVSVAAYPETLRGRRPATEVFFASSQLDLMAGIYRGNRVYDFYIELAARFVANAVEVEAAARTRPVRVLELGAGTGGASHAVLAQLARLVETGTQVEYHYTDLGGSFVAHGRRTFAAKHPFVRFRLYDMEKSPTEQGLEAHGIDIVVASGALHAVADIDVALLNIGELLAPSGLLVLAEAVENHDIMAVTIGLLDGWHAYRDPERRIANSPLLSMQGWESAFERTGFVGAVGYGPGLTGDADPGHRIIVAGRPPARRDVSTRIADERTVTADGVASSRAAVASPAGRQVEARGTNASPTSEEEPSVAIERYITEVVADALGVETAEIRRDRSLAEFGVDSILATSIVKRLNEGLGLSERPTVLFDYPSVRALSDLAISEGASVPLAAPAPETAPPVPDEPASSRPPTPVEPSSDAVDPERDTSLHGSTIQVSSPAQDLDRNLGEPIDIAIVGMACRYPDADDYGTLWQNIRRGRDSITEVPASRWAMEELYEPWPPKPGKTYCRWGGYLDDIGAFDPLFFGILPSEADLMDPQQRLFLQEAWRAIEDAGIDPTRLRESRCGIFAGAPPSDYAGLISRQGHFAGQGMFTGNSPAILPARVAYHLDVTGPCMGIDTACSSSLVALNLACRSLQAGECDLALAGGVAAFATPEHLQLTASLGMLSPTGRCRAFDAGGDGIVMSEGVGVALLKPLKRALDDGDPIHAVIKGVAVNQDGRTNGITAPSMRSQVQLLTEVYERFGIDRASIGYVETHGTGTKLGDPIELEALTTAFRDHAPAVGRIPLGSIKTNIGHSSHAAGIAGLIKVTMALRDRTIPASLHFDEPNPLIAFEQSPFYVNTETRPWEGECRRAAVSSFGFSGTNCHVVVEEHPDRRPPTECASDRVVVPISARDERSLRDVAGALSEYFMARPDLELGDVAATLQLGRAAFEERACVLAHSLRDLTDQLDLLARGRPAQGVQRGSVDPDVRPGAKLSVTPTSDLRELAAAWLAGREVDFAGLYSGRKPRRVHLPGYVFARERCWIPDTSVALTQAPSSVGSQETVGGARSAPAESAGVVENDVEPVDNGDRVRPIVAEFLGLSVRTLASDRPSDELGLSPSDRIRIVERVNDTMGVALSANTFTSTMSVDEFASRVAAVRSTLGSNADQIIDRKSSVTPVEDERPKRSAPSPDAMKESPRVRVERYLAQVLAKEARLPLERIRPKAPLQDYGIESVMVTRLLDRLGRDWGTLPSTLFFEYGTVRELAGYFVEAHGDRLERVLAASESAAAATRPQSVAGQPAPRLERSAGAPSRAVEAAGEGVKDTSVRDQDVAIIGMSGRFPQADGVDALWANLLGGVDCIEEIPADRWDYRRYLGDNDEPGTTYARWGGFMPDVDRFDARFFGITPKDAEGMDPQQRVFLETAWAALEDGGYTPERIRRSAARRGKKDAGVFAGVTYGEYQLFVGVPIAGYWAVANRVSYHLGFNGPSMAIDTACSSSLTALHQACESLRRGECGYAIAGGVNVTIHPGKYLLLGMGHWASSDGRCRAFGADGDGYVPSEGVAALLMKPLSEALEDGDRILGVIRASAVNQDGRTNGFTVPSPTAQAELVHDALVQAGVDARSVSYVEAHGTGTSLGDPIEVAALTKAFSKFTSDRGYCAIGSAKSGLGHLEAAAGVAGVVKVLLQLQNDTIAPSIHATPPNPHIDFAAGPFNVAREAMPWPRSAKDGDPRLAAVSSFGAGGSNAHVIVSDGPRTVCSEQPSREPQLILLSARREEVLRTQARNLAARLRTETGGQLHLADVAWTLAVGREAFTHRAATVVNSIEQLLQRLDLLADSGGAPEGWMQGRVDCHANDDGDSEADLNHVRSLWRAGDREGVGRLWIQGWEVDWTPLLAEGSPRVVSLPSYPFVRDRFWIDPADFGVQSSPLQVEQPAPASQQADGESASNETAPAGPDKTAVAASSSSELRADVEAKVIEIFSDLTKTPKEDLDVDVEFLDIGFDSVVNVRMLNRLMKAYGVRIPGAVIEAYTTIRSLVDHVLDEGYIGRPGETNSASESADSAILTAPARTPDRLVLDEPIPVESIFITGVTGVLGGKLLYDLLSTTSIRVSCLVRGKDVAAARERVRYFLSVYDIEGRLEAAFRSRVEVVLGDVSEERMGLSATEYERLAAGTDLIIHAAARTTLITFYDALAPVNVQGTRNAIDFALKTRQRYLAYVSSFSVLGDWQIHNNPPFRESDIEVGQSYDHLPYQETKYHSEKLIRAATDQGLTWNIFRPGNIMGDGRTGRYPFAEVTVKGVFYDMFKTVAQTGITMLSPNHWDVSPVDYVSAALLHLSLRHPSYREVYHLTNPDIRSLYDVFRMIGKFGYETRPVTIEEFHKMAVERRFRNRDTGQPYESQTIEMVKYGVEIWGREHYEQSSAPDCAFTRAILEPAGIHCPTIAELIPLYLEHCVRVGYIEAPPGRVLGAADASRPAPNRGRSSAGASPTGARTEARARTQARVLGGV